MIVRKVLFVSLFLSLAAPLALAGLTGDVADVAPANTAVRQRDNASFTTMPNPIQEAIDDPNTIPGDTILIGPGWYKPTAAAPSGSGAGLIKTRYVGIKLVGSGSLGDPNTNTVIDAVDRSDGGFGEGISINACGSGPSDRTTLKDLRVQNTTAHATIFRNVDGSSLTNKWVLYDNVAMVNYGPGFASGIDINTSTGGMVAQVIIRNSQFGPSAAPNVGPGAGVVGVRGASTSVARDWTFENCLFTGMLRGLRFQGEEVSRLKVVNCEFKDLFAGISSSNNGTPDDPNDDYEFTFGCTGIECTPRKRNLGSPPHIGPSGEEYENGVAKNITIMNCTFEDIGFQGDWPNVLPNQQELHYGAGWGANAAVGDDGAAEVFSRVRVADNTFSNTVAGLEMKYGIHMRISDEGDPNNPPGEYRYVSLDNNTYSVSTTDIYGQKTGSGSEPNIELYPVDLNGTPDATFTKVGDSNADDLINDADIDLNAVDADRDGDVDADDRDALVWHVIKTFKGDADLNGIVAFPDFIILAGNYGSSGGWGDGDFDASGDVQFPDFIILAGNYGKHSWFYCGTDMPPEP